MTASSEVVGPGDLTNYSLTVTNTGDSDLTSVSASVQLPPSISRFGNGAFSCGGFCDANERTTWAVGTLAPGESRTTNYLVRYNNSATAGVASSSVTASAVGASDATASLDVTVDLSPLLRLSVAPESGPAVAGEPFTYTLTFGNVGSTSPTGVVLTMAVPDGAAFASATDGGAESGGLVTWDLGTLGVGAAGQVRLTVDVGGSVEDGEVLETVAEINPNVAGEPVMRSSAVTPVRGGVPLRFEYAVSQTALGTGDLLDVALTATNTSAVDLTGVTAAVRLPDGISRFGNGAFSCGGFCDANERTTWAVGTLAPGESRTTTFRTRIASGTEQGEVLRSLLTATSTGSAQVSASQDWTIDPTPRLRINLTPDPGPAVAGEPFTYTLTFGNVGSPTTSAVLRMPIPEGSAFASASANGTFSDGVVTWEVGALGNGDGGQFRLTVMPDASLGNGDMLLAEAEIDPRVATELVVRSSAVTAIRTEGPLQVEYDVSPRTTEPGAVLTYTLTVTNTSAVDLTDVTAAVRLPDGISRFGNGAFSCGGFCDANEWTTWAVGTLAPGATESVTFSPTVTSGATRGNILASSVRVTATGSNEVVLFDDVYLGAAIDRDPPMAPLDLTATAAEDDVSLSWTANTEGDLDGYRLYRRAGENAQELVATLSAGATSYLDEDLDAGSYTYQLLAFDTSNNESGLSNEVEVTVVTTDSDDGRPLEFTVTAAPTPATSAIRFRIAQPTSAHVRLAVYDALGREVAVLLDEDRPAGDSVVRWDAAVPAGVYLWQFTTDATARTGSVTVVR